MATACDKAFRILTEREIREILKDDTVGRTPREVDRPALDRRAKRALFSAGGFSDLPGVEDEFRSRPASSPLTYGECEGGTPYWGTWGLV
jgi:hypothetical protein